MRTNLRTITLAEIRRQIRNATKWYDLDSGLPHFYSSENYKRSKRIYIRDIRNKDYPYYVKSDKAIAEIAEKIYNLVKKDESTTEKKRRKKT